MRQGRSKQPSWLTGRKLQIQGVLLSGRSNPHLSSPPKKSRDLPAEFVVLAFPWTMYDRAAGWPPRDSLREAPPGQRRQPLSASSQHGDLVQQEWPKLPFLLQNFRSFYQKHTTG
jgi:hypothetical protein